MLEDDGLGAIGQRVPEGPAVDEVGCTAAETGQRGAGVGSWGEGGQEGGGDGVVLVCHCVGYLWWDGVVGCFRENDGDKIKLGLEHTKVKL